MKWEYRVHTASTNGDDAHDSQILTHLARPSIPETESHGWEIFHVTPLENGKTRLFMKRPAQDF